MNEEKLGETCIPTLSESSGETSLLSPTPRKRLWRRRIQTLLKGAHQKDKRQ